MRKVLRGERGTAQRDREELLHVCVVPVLLREGEGGMRQRGCPQTPSPARCGA